MISSELCITTISEDIIQMYVPFDCKFRVHNTTFDIYCTNIISILCTNNLRLEEGNDHSLVYAYATTYLFFSSKGSIYLRLRTSLQL